LPAPEPKIEVSPEGIATLPKKTPPSETPAARGLADDRLASEAAARRLQEAEAAKAVVTKAEAAKNRNARALETYSMITGMGPKITPARVLSGGTDFSGTTPPSEIIEGPPISDAPYPDEYTRGIKPRPETPVDQAKKVAEQVTAPPESPLAPKTTGFSNEDILTLGLNMMMAQPGQPGGELSQLASNVGRSGLATLQSRVDRSKLATEQAFRELYGKYLGKQTEVMGQPTGEDAVIAKYAKDRGIGYADAYEEISGFKSRNAYIQAYNKQALDPINGEAFRAKYPTMEDYLRAEGVGGYTISTQAQDALNLYK
jgi:hypothetical protein